MATWYSSITDEQADMIRNAPIFFVGSADPSMGKGPNGIGPVNVSPKGGVPLHILSPNKVAFLDYVGSGNETARHAEAGGHVTIMICSFEEENAGIMRLYGKARVSSLEESPLADLLLESPAEEIALPMRQVIEVEVESTITSCGYGVPVMSFVKDRTVSERGRRYKESRTSTTSATA